MLVSIVIPVYNSPVLGELAARIERVFADQSDDDFEIIFVDDASPDARVWPTLQSLAATSTRIKALQLTRNFGQQPATLCGFQEARGDVVITMDDDLQHSPEDIPRFLARRDYDIVVGQFARKQHGVLKRITSKIKGYFDRIIIGKPKHIQLSSYRMLSRTVVDGVLAMRTPHPFIPALMFHVSKNVAGVDAHHQARKQGRSGYTLVKQVRLFSNLIINNSSLVLRAVGYAGITIAATSVLLAFLIVYRKLVYGSALMGWTSLIVTVLLMGGLGLFSIGVVGEYLIRIIDASESKPTHFVRRRVGTAVGWDQDAVALNPAGRLRAVPQAQQFDATHGDPRDREP